LTIMALKGPLHKWKSTQVCPYWWWDHEPFSSVYSTTISQHMSYHILQPCNTILSHLWPTQCHSSQFEELMKGHLKVKMHGLVQKTQIIQCLNYVDIAFMRSHITSLNYCILQTKTPPSFPCTCDTHMWRKEGRVDHFLKHKIYNSTLSTTMYGVFCIQFEVRFWCTRTILN
jgi:hypothetical protein